MKNLVLNENLAPTFITKNIIESKGWSRAGMQGAESSFPLYLYVDAKALQSIAQSAKRTPSLNLEIINQIAEKLNSTFTDEKETTKGTF